MAKISDPVKKAYHFIGIGGIGMSGLARLFLHRGQVVSGSDLKASCITDDLKLQGAKVFIGHSAENLQDAQAVIYSSAIKADNPELAAAIIRKLPLLMRAEALAALMVDKTVITVSGSHGKTTTTSLVSCLLLEAGLEPTAAIGGILKNIDTNACLGSGEFFVAEADESDGSFLYYHPKYSIVTNIDREHLDYYQTFERELETFRKFMAQTNPHGCLFCCGDDPNLRGLLRDCNNKYVTFGLDSSSDIYPDKINFRKLTSEFDCIYKGNSIGRFSLALAGRHNISNALSVIALGFELGIDPEVIKKTLRGYKGAGRRLEVKFDDGRILLLDDYAHHPAEIKATLSAAKNIYPSRLIAVFQPHRYTRTKNLLNEFAASFDDADYVAITDIYPAGEAPIAGVNAGLIAEGIKKRCPDKQVFYMAKDEIVPNLLKVIKPRDLVITLGAGDIVKVCDEMVGKFKM